VSATTDSSPADPRSAESHAWRTYRRLLGYARPYWPLLMAAGIGMLIEAAAAGAFATLMKPMINQTFIARNRDLNLLMPLAIIGIFVLRGMATLTTDYGMARAGRSIVRDLRVALLDKYLRLASSTFDHTPVPRLVSRLNYDTEQVAQASTEALKIMITDTLIIIAMVSVMIWNSAKITLAVLIMAPAIAFIFSTVSSRYRRLNRGIQDGIGNMAHSAEQTLAGQQEVRIYGAQRAELDRFAVMANRNLRLNLKVEFTRGLSSSLVQLIAALALATILYLAGREAAAGRLDAGQFVSLMIAMMSLIPSLRRVANIQGAVQRGVTASDTIFRILDGEEEIDRGTRPLSRTRGELEFRDVSVRYHGQEHAALRNVSFRAQAGTVTAIVGRSGSGKSTLVSLLPRFYEPESGQVLLDGIPVSDYRLADLRRQIAYVGQRVMLFDDSVAANIGYGDDAPDAARVSAAAATANALEFIERMPDAFGAHIGERGGRLSGGQRQRLAIARAVYKNAPLLILDEATAALDSESERLVQDALQHLIADRTTLVIAHRLSTIEHADQVLVLDKGELVEQGTHAELLARGGLYAHLHQMQFRETQAS
jgi:subfamily B ATP-binding cassette protein MsbA